jgi:hypothetical protein
MATARIKQNDTTRSVTDTLLLGEAPINLTGATVVLVLKRKGGEVIRKSATITDAPSGKVSCALGANETSQPEQFQAEWEVTLNGGGIITVPDDSYHIIQVLPDLG